ncbi:hypothetical protein PtA15_1A781 [Puccinia triticina]|uniref:Uncharacterized protein n=1 Tax=Puccinia triticina TaxID=208348 RepID=A0ABY7CC47_9BASI|nr:uncharacterized protein PtA15_1A781 [Puccinia triticina]WAQ81440.1 hypothetical protein PtA15_1A781 [Puccinia triticina]
MLQKAKITLATGDSFIDGEDRLRFVGKFIPVGEAHQFVRHPSGDTPRASKSYAASSGTWTRGKTIFQVNLMTADNSDTPLRNSNLEQHHTEWRRVQVSGVGTVVKIKSKPSWPDTSVILADITVEHTGEVTQVTVSSEDLLDNDSDGTSSLLNVDF